MRRPSLYSRSSGSRATRDPEPVAQAQPARPTPPSSGKRNRLRTLFKRFERPLLVALGGLVAVGLLVTHAMLTPNARVFTQRDIDQAVLHTLATKTIPSPEARAFENVRRSVVRVRGMALGKDGGDTPVEEAVGSGVVIVDSGVILTNLHVVSQAKILRVVFFDGSESDAVVIGTQPENDLAVLRAKTIPDDLPAATLRSTGDLTPGDHVVAVGFPFGIGPSVSAGVISGLRREFRSTEGKRVLTNLIQFDAAANPGSSGGPLVTTDGEVVGIVTAILNPTAERFFVGIGFAVPIENAASGVGIHPF